MNLEGQSADEIIATIDRTLRDMFDELRGSRPTWLDARHWNCRRAEL